MHIELSKTLVDEPHKLKRVDISLILRLHEDAIDVLKTMQQCDIEQYLRDKLTIANAVDFLDSTTSGRIQLGADFYDSKMIGITDRKWSEDVYPNESNESLLGRMIRELSWQIKNGEIK